MGSAHSWRKDCVLISGPTPPSWHIAVHSALGTQLFPSHNSAVLHATSKCKSKCNNRSCWSIPEAPFRLALMQVVGEYHLGEFVNRFRPGSLVMKLPDTEVGPAAAFR